MFTGIIETTGVLKDVRRAGKSVTLGIMPEMITFDVSIPCSLASDGKIQTIEVQRSTVPAEYKYVTVPKMSSVAYLTA